MTHVYKVVWRAEGSSRLYTEEFATWEKAKLCFELVQGDAQIIETKLLETIIEERTYELQSFRRGN